MDTITERLTTELLSFDRPFPALTPAERYHFDLFGYVVVENTLAPVEVSRIKNALFRLRDRLQQLDDHSSTGPRVDGAYLNAPNPYLDHLAHIIAADPDVTAYATHPFMVSMAEEIMGGEARVVETGAIINRRLPDEQLEEQPEYDFHRGADIPFASHTHQGLYHCNFVKTLTNLTDLGPDDGGTVVVAGSHKIDLATKDLVEVAREDPRLIHQIVAAAGSTLLFCETLIHATAPIRSDNERVIIITGYGTTMFPFWDDGQLSDEFRSKIPQQLKALLEGKAHWRRGARYRVLTAPADRRRFEMGDWNQRPPTARGSSESQQRVDPS